MRKIKSFRLLSLVIIAILCLSIGSFAAVKVWQATLPSYETKVNGEKITGNEALNVEGNTFLKARYITEQMGGTVGFTNGIATFDKGNKGSTGGFQELSVVTKSVVRIVKNNTIIGNGFFVSKDKILLTKNAYQLGSFKILNYKGETITISPTPLKVGSRLVLLKTNGLESKYVLNISSKDVEAGDAIGLCTSFYGTPNMWNFSTVKDKFDFNWLTTGDKEYLRTYNDSAQTCQGAPLLNESLSVVGIYIYDGNNYSLGVTLNDINDFLD